jgi:hypothetical protein
MEAKDPSKKHFQLSMIKSGLRIAGCVIPLALGLTAIGWFFVLFLAAELLGIAEEF